MSSSLLNVSDDASRKPEEFSLNDIEVFVDSKEQNWFKRAHMGKFLETNGIWTSTTKLSEKNIRSRPFLQAEGGVHPGRRDQKEWDIFLSRPGVSHVISKCRKPTSNLINLANHAGL